MEVARRLFAEPLVFVHGVQIQRSVVRFIHEVSRGLSRLLARRLAAKLEAVFSVRCVSVLGVRCDRDMPMQRLPNQRAEDKKIDAGIKITGYAW